MTFKKVLLITLLCLLQTGSQWAQTSRQLKEVYQNNDFQITGIAVSKSGRLFVNFPRWSDRYLYAVVEVAPDGSAKPFPDEHWNQWDLKPQNAAKQFVCVQSVVVDGSDVLWVLDPAAPMLATVVPGGPKLVKINLKTNQVERIFAFGSDTIKSNTYLNDVRFDNQRHTAYITDSGPGGLIILDLDTGKAHRALDGDRSVLAEAGVRIVVDGKELLAFGKSPQFNSDSIALSPDGQYLYYKPITAKSLYRIKTDILRDSMASAAKISAAVEKVGDIFPTDGFWMDSVGNLYLSNVTHDAVGRRSPEGKIETIISDPRLQWPDSFAQGADGTIYVSASHINDSPTFNKGKSTRTQPYGVFSFKPK
ncbi:MAG TPA: L-dopachrome tautomerase-related protein [Candidatus Sulfotelmatobacter sp.]